MQSNVLFKYLAWFFRFILVTSFLLGIYQNYVSNDGSIQLFGFTLTQFYPHIERRIFPLTIAAFGLVPFVKKQLSIQGNFYFTEFLISGLCALDAFTHVNGLYNVSFVLPFYERIWFDKATHFLEGLILLPAIYPLLFAKFSKVLNGCNIKKWSYWSTIGFISIFFILWEIIEVITDKYFSTRLITGSFDTNEDLMFAFSGFLIAFVIMEVFFKGRLFLSKNTK